MGINQIWCVIPIIFVSMASIHNARLFVNYDIRSPFLGEVHAIPPSCFVPSSVYRWWDHCAMPSVSPAIIHLAGVALVHRSMRGSITLPSTVSPTHSPCSRFNSLCPSDAIWQHRSGSTLAQVMACCLTAPSHYLNQCWLIISEVQWRAISQETCQPSTIKISLEIIYLKILSILPEANELP